MRPWTAALILMLAACSGGGSRLVVGAGTSLVDGGLIDALAADYEAAHPNVELSVVGEATAKVLALSRSGAVDVTITHAPDLEAAFEAEGLAASAATVFSSRFVLVGPPERALTLSGSSVSEAFARIAADGLLFVSRADESGTHLVEKEIWREAGIDPTDRPWYLETGQGMGLTLQVTSERGGFTLSELGTFLAARANLALVNAGVTGSSLANPYRAMAVRGSLVEDEAVAFVEWLASDEGRDALRRIDGHLFDTTVYEPFEEDPAGTG